MKKVLLIDDDKRLAELLIEYLPRHEMEVFSALLPETCLKMLRQHALDMIILDIMLPGKNSFEVCKEIRAESDVPFIMLTARGEVTDRIVGSFNFCRRRLISTSMDRLYDSQLLPRRESMISSRLSTLPGFLANSSNAPYSVVVRSIGSRAHGGELHLESREGEGTTVTLVFGEGASL